MKPNLPRIRFSEFSPPRSWSLPLGCAKPAAAFTLIECLAVLVAIGLLACVALPVLAGTKSDSQRIFCVNNLRQIGQAWAGYKNEHDDQMPPYLYETQGGLRNTAYLSTVWRHYFLLSNHLATPKLLKCPADPKTAIAVDWSLRANGLQQPGGLGDSAVSYFVGLHGRPEFPAEVIGGDFGIGGMVSSSCGLAGATAWMLSGTNTTVGWTNYSHWSTGNLLLNDGQVKSTTDEELRHQLRSSSMAEANLTHLVVPKP